MSKQSNFSSREVWDLEQRVKKLEDTVQALTDQLVTNGGLTSGNRTSIFAYLPSWWR
jgi:hypothetical protein